MTTGISTTHNSTYKKLAVQWLNKHLCFVSCSVVADSFVLPCLPVGREIATFAKPENVSGNLRTTPYTKLRKQENQNGTTKNI
jgi:hypothetical protein